jgi:hypothetical protein
MGRDVVLVGLDEVGAVDAPVEVLEDQPPPGRAEGDERGVAAGA